MGTLASWLARGKKPINVANSCVSCGLCARACPMNLTPYKESKFAHPDCLKCGECIKVCPKKALSFENDVVNFVGKTAGRTN
jgi:ferredoxin